MGEYADYYIDRMLDAHFQYRRNYKKKDHKDMAFSSKDQIIVIRGEFNWPIIVGDPRPYTGNPAFDKGPYWSVDVTPDAKSRALLKAAKISNKLRDPSEKSVQKESFLSLKVNAFDKDGKAQDAPKISDAQGKPWDGSKIGNGSVGDVKIKVKDYGTTKGVYVQAVRVLSHVPYESADFAPLSSDDIYWASGTKSLAADSGSEDASNTFDDLEDDVPF